MHPVACGEAASGGGDTRTVESQGPGFDPAPPLARLRAL